MARSQSAPPGVIARLSLVGPAVPGGLARDPLEDYVKTAALAAAEALPGLDVRVVPLGPPTIAPEEALHARVAAVGRVPAEHARDLLRRSRDRGTLMAWCGGDLPLDVEAECPLVILGREEAARALNTDSRASAVELALGMARRANVAGAVRAVFGGSTKTSAVVCEGRGVWRCLEADPIDADPRHLAGIADVFAARFLAAAVDDRSRRTDDLAIHHGLQHARFAVAHYTATGVHPSAEQIEAALAARPEYSDRGALALRDWTVPRPGGFLFKSLNWLPRPLA